MILLTPQFSENFGNSEKRNSTAAEVKRGKDCFGIYDGEKLYNEEYVEIFSPTVFETVEVYTSSSSDYSDRSDFNDATFPDADSSSSSTALNLDSINTVNSLENLEPGTYTLDVLQSTDLDFDAMFTNLPASELVPSNLSTDGTSKEEASENVKNNKLSKKLKIIDDGVKKMYKLRNCKNSSRKPLSTKYLTRNVSAREFLNNFSNNLRKTEEPLITHENEEEGKSLSWLLDFKVSSIFHPVESEPDNLERVKRKSNDLQKKPRYTYTELIEQALKENGELTVSGIYNWISNHYPYYQQNDDRWKNSVRHNLSINPQFRKGKKASQGAGHFWNISDTVSQSQELNNNKTPTFCRSVDSLRHEKVPFSSNKPISESVSDLINQIDEEVLAATKSIQENENMKFTDVSLHDAAETQIQPDGKQTETSFVNITRNDIEQLWESTNDNSEHRFSSFSPLIREITEETSNMEEENFLIEDIHNSICLGDELFANSSYYGLTII